MSDDKDGKFYRLLPEKEITGESRRSGRANVAGLALIAQKVFIK